MQKNSISVNPTNQVDLQELKKQLNLPNSTPEVEVEATWRMIRHMNSVLELPVDTPIKTLVELFEKLREIQQVFKLQNTNFIQLNVLHVELITVRDMLNLPETMSIVEVINQITPEILPTLGVGEDSFLEKVLRLQQR